MCLVIENGNTLIAQEDITCYKVLKLSESRKTWISPFQDHPYKLNAQAESKLIVIPRYEISMGGEILVVDTGLHSFVNKEDALAMVQRMENWVVTPMRFSDRYAVFVATIPKGSSYFSGKHKTSVGFVKSYASSALIVSDVLVSAVQTE